MHSFLYKSTLSHADIYILSVSFTTLFASELNYSTVEIAISNFHPLLLFQGVYAVV